MFSVWLVFTSNSQSTWLKAKFKLSFGPGCRPFKHQLSCPRSANMA